MKLRVLVSLVAVLVLVAGVVPAALANESVNIDWEPPNGHKSTSLEVDFRVVDRGEDHFFAQTFDLTTGGGGYIGLKNNPNGFFDPADHFKFSMWRTNKNGNTAADVTIVDWAEAKGWWKTHSENGGGIEAWANVPWKTNRTYTLELRRTASRTTYDRWSAWVRWEQAGGEKRQYIATIQITHDPGVSSKIFDTGTFSEDKTRSQCQGTPPHAELRVWTPQLGPKNAAYESATGDCANRWRVSWQNPWIIRQGDRP